MENPTTGTPDNISQLETARDDLMSADLARQPSTREDMEMGLPGHGQETEPAHVNGEAVENRPKMSFRLLMMNFTPSFIDPRWFIITMGTGVVSILLHQLPYYGYWLAIFSNIFFVLNTVLFITFFLISSLRYSSYPQIWFAVLRHPHQSLFLGTFPVGLATIANMIVLVCVPAWGQHWVILAWVLWWIIVVLALAACFHMSYNVMSSRKSDLSKMTALWLIPVVSVVIASSSGALVAGALTDPEHKLLVLIISYVLWGIGFPLALVIMVLYFLRLTIYEPPEREVIISLLLPIGPLGLAAFSLIQLGKVAQKLFPITNSLPLVPNAGDIIYTTSFLVSLIIWGFAILWFFVAVAQIIQTRHFPFNMGWWGFVFPIGIFALSTITIGNELASRFFKVLGTVLTVITIILWIVCAAGTVQRSITGKMFYAPCLGTDMKLKKQLEGKTSQMPKDDHASGLNNSKIVPHH